jgi:pilus assembly protein CpaE
MKVESPYSLLDATENLHRLDAGYWKGVVTKYCDGLDLLPGPGATSIREAPTAERVRHVIRFTQPLYSWIVLDLGRLTASSLGMLDDTRDLFLVTTPHLTSLVEAGRILRRLLEAGFAKERLHLLLNRKARKSSIALDEIEKALGYTIYGAINDTPEEIAEKYVERRFLDDNLQVHKQVTQLVQKWRGVEEKATSGSGLGFLKRLRTA